MFLTIFEVRPGDGQQSAYLDVAKALKPELLNIDGFITVIRSKSLIHDGWVLSLSTWRDEKALVRWRTHAKHHKGQERGREQILEDYHLRIAEVTQDSSGEDLPNHRFDLTRTGKALSVAVIECDSSKLEDPNSEDALVAVLGSALARDIETIAGLVTWDVFNAILDPGDLTVLLSFETLEQAETFISDDRLPNVVRKRSSRVVRDYGKFDRDEAPQYYPDVPRKVVNPA